MRCFEDFARHVELHLRGRGIADSHRPGSPISLEMVERLLRRHFLSRDRVYDPHRLLALDRQVIEPVEEIHSFLLIPDSVQCVENERRVAEPREAIIPVSRATDFFRKRRRRRGNQRPRRIERQQFQRQRAAPHEILIRTAIGAQLRPLIPVPQGARECGFGFLIGHGPSISIVVVAAVRERDPQPLACPPRGIDRTRPLWAEPIIVPGFGAKGVRPLTMRSRPPRRSSSSFPCEQNRMSAGGRLRIPPPHPALRSVG